jgi:hypothetical protein
MADATKPPADQREPALTEQPRPDHLTPLHACDSDEQYQQEISAELRRLLANWERLNQISSMVTDMHAWGILVLRELGAIRADSDATIRRLAVDMAQSGHMQQQEIARLTGFSRNTISAWVRKNSGQLPPEPPDDMTDPAQIDH